MTAWRVKDEREEVGNGIFRGSSISLGDVNAI